MPPHASCLTRHPAPEGLARLCAFDQGPAMGLVTAGGGARWVALSREGDTHTLWEGARPENTLAVGSPCGRSVALAVDGAVEVFDLSARRRLHRLPLSSPRAVASRLQWDTPNRLIAVTAEAEVFVWRPQEGTTLTTWTAAMGEEVTTAGDALPEDPPIFTEQRRSPEGWVGRLRRRDDGAVVREVCVPFPAHPSPFEAAELTVRRGSLDLAASFLWDDGATRRSSLHLWRDGQHVPLGELSCAAAPDERQPIWDVQILTPGLVLTRGWAGCRVWDAETRSSRELPKPAGGSRDGLMLGRDDTVTDLKTGEATRLGEGGATTRAISPDGRLVVLGRGAALEWWTITR
jgi:hypothetical protein